jgi:hypothetical protein
VREVWVWVDSWDGVGGFFVVIFRERGGGGKIFSN